jgi:cytochrome c biogenesis protein CcmG, thiol:disulfide interchange protein DsbE
MRFLIPLGVFLIMLVFLGIGLSLDPREIPSPLIGKPAPAFDLPTLDSGIRLRSEALKGEGYLLNVWASWCEACRAEHPVLLDLARKGQVRIVGLNYKDTPDKALAWLKAHGGDPYRVVAVDADGRVGINFGVYGVPETFVIDAEGIIRYKHTGPLTPKVLEEKILPLLSAPATGKVAP